jgi:N-methylhydantoinase A
VIATRIGVDIGGTFTDLIFYDDRTGEVRVAKTATTPQALEEGVLEAVESSVPSDLVRESQLFMHGTTIGLNALLEAKGARTGLLCTAGFRDSLEIRRADRDVMYDLMWRQPPPLVRRRFRVPVRERVRADGEVLVPLEAGDISAALAVFEEAGIEAIAVSFINAYVNPEHELRAEEELRRRGFDGEISLSHRLSREYREYERTSTAVVDAYIRGATSRYLKGLRNGLDRVGFRGDILVTRSGGGAMTADELEQRPFEAIQSGPVAGAEGAGELCRLRGWDLAVTADVGGTSFDTALIVDGRPHVKAEGDIVGWPLQTAWVDVVSIGAGGGSIAYADDGLLKVGPQSAGADPGPACYGRGGTQPTVTDAALLLGMLGDGVFASGLRLLPDLADTALRPLAEELGLGLEETACGVLTVVNSAMADAMREITIGQGEDPRRARLIAFGGAGPLFATLLAAELGVPEVIVPPHAGNFSAWGLLGQDVTRETARTMIRPFAPAIVPELNEQLDEMFAELHARGRDDGPASDRVVRLDLRYIGQDHTLTIAVRGGDGRVPEDLAAIAAAFGDDYERRFGTTLDLDLELVTIRATARTRLPRQTRERVVDVDGAAPSRPRSLVGYSFTTRERVEFALLERAQIERGGEAEGPVIVLEPTATTYVDAGWKATADELGCISLERTTGER